MCLVGKFWFRVSLHWSRNEARSGEDSLQTILDLLVTLIDRLFGVGKRSSSQSAIDAVEGRAITRRPDVIESRRKPQKLPYVLKGRLLSHAELSFCLVLQGVVGDRAGVCPKVNLGDVFKVAGCDGSEQRSFRNKIDRKHVDFLLCDAATFRPLCGIELDDKSHQVQKQIEKDLLKDEAFAAAGLPLIRIKAARNYTPRDIDKQLTPYIGASSAQPSSMRATATSLASPPSCPKCGIGMIERTAKRGADAGKKFWGCANYPNCREVVDRTAN